MKSPSPGIVPRREKIVGDSGFVRGMQEQPANDQLAGNPEPLLR